MSEVEQSAHMRITATTEGMTDAAKKRFEVCVQRFANDLSRETMRLEEGARAPDLDEREITTTMVMKANEVVRTPPSNVMSPATTAPIQVIQTIAAIFAIVTGVIGGYLHSSWQWIVFLSMLVATVVALGSSAYMIWRRR